ncbi:MAG: hypothetical protein FWH19_04155 [Treponema sp.]|nr:hypothetical protein [Treponema sp.]
MKNFAKLVLFVSFCFAFLFLISVLIRFLDSWIDFVRFIPLGEIIGAEVAEAAWNALPSAIYLSVLLCLSYTARRGIAIPLSMGCIIALCFAFTSAASLGIERTASISPLFKPASPIVTGPGLILSQRNNTMILLRESSDLTGPRVVSIPDQPLIYQEQPIGPNNTILSLPALPFSVETPWFIQSLSIDLSLCAWQLKSRFQEGFIYFAAYALGLILLLGSLRFLLELSLWPLANLFLGALVFRLILSLEVFLNSREINTLLSHYLGELVPSLLITPLAFGSAGVLLILFTLLGRLARIGRKKDG